MISNILFDLNPYQTALAYVVNAEDDWMKLSNFKRWRKIEQAYGEDFFLDALVSAISHETMHKVIETIEHDDPSVGMDNLDMEEGLVWELARF